MAKSESKAEVLPHPTERIFVETSYPLSDKAGTATPTAASALAHTPASTSAATFMNRAAVERVCTLFAIPGLVA